MQDKIESTFMKSRFRTTIVFSTLDWHRCRWDLQSRNFIKTKSAELTFSLR